LRPSHRRGAPATTPSAEDTGPVLGTGVLLEEGKHQFGHRIGGLRVRVVPGPPPGSAKSGSSVPVMTRAGHLTLDSCACESAGVALKVFMNSAIRPGSRSLAASAAI